MDGRRHLVERRRHHLHLDLLVFHLFARLLGGGGGPRSGGVKRAGGVADAPGHRLQIGLQNLDRKLQTPQLIVTPGVHAASQRIVINGPRLRRCLFPGMSQKKPGSTAEKGKQRQLQKW